MRTGAAAGHRGYFHETAFYDSDEAFLSTIVPFFTAGLEAGEPVVAAFAATNQNLIHDVFGDDSGIRYLGGEAQYLRPASAIRTYRELFGRYAAAGVQQIRVAGDVPHPGVGVPWDSWRRYEAAVNHAYDEFPVWGVCPYDTRTAPDHVIAEVRRTHPHIAHAGGHAANPAFEDPVGLLLAHRSDHWCDPLEQQPPHLELLDPGSGPARGSVAALAGDLLTAEDHAGLLVAVSEAVTNAEKHGRAPVVLRAWAGPRRVVVTVTDSGDGPTDPFAGLLAKRDAPSGGLGLWISHQVCGYVGLQSAPGAFTIRLLAGDLPA
ncbi:transcriptional regulator [Actinoplanes sp. SE50]|uniref:anti-sigma factor RsbA family regulatory protein n=1 Tax=unclassified Actinoplanes TaxID=2626549 RepID=UPI00023ED236|nr:MULTISPECIES: anti-sigma factor RsbA family regulatory protein [unclassified Actinoplanes]AEV84412.1 Anti-sigma F factor [Actinoplanes sp. SE50/110]ATO82804.1 transcriptional regulator [Actinoplanes sp. SE50]SLM00212.1 anti-sigma regulatory factor serine/threonine protein kinase [Actinoplanes sp. SE50/110]